MEYVVLLLAVAAIWIVGACLCVLVRHSWYYFWGLQGWRPEFYKESVVKSVEDQFAYAILKDASGGAWEQMSWDQQQELVERMKDHIHGVIVTYIKGYLDMWLPPIGRKRYEIPRQPRDGRGAAVSMPDGRDVLPQHRGPGEN